MNNNRLIAYKEKIINKISNFFKKIFFRKKNNVKAIGNSNNCNNNDKENFIENIVIKENEEEKRLKNIKFRYDNGEIDEKDILEEDIDKLIEMYKKEIEELNADTEKRKKHISQMLKEIKAS